MDDTASLRRAMVDQQIIARGVSDPRVIDAMLAVPRHRFVPEEGQGSAYADGPQPIGAGQTISQPYIVALMIEALAVRPDDRILEIGAGSGYAAAVMSRIASEVHAIERIAPLAERARRTIDELEYTNLTIIAADGTEGLAHAAPFDAILVSAATAAVPPALFAQLAPRGRLVIPLGSRLYQQLTRYRREANGEVREDHLGGVVFVPLIGTTDQAATTGA